MKRTLLVIGVILTLLAGCSGGRVDKVTITTDRNAYTPLMSSAQGITMTPHFETDKIYDSVIYHWQVAEGEFIGAGKEVKNQGQPVLWSAVANGEMADTKNPFDIKLEVTSGESGRVLATAKITIVQNDIYYEVKQS